MGRIPMDDPMFDEHGYPMRETLDEIATWPIERGHRELLEFARRAFHPRYGYLEPGKSRLPSWWQEEDEETWVAATGGWSGNEDVISALHQNTGFWLTCWRASVVGGYYEYGVRRAVAPCGDRRDCETCINREDCGYLVEDDND